MTKKNWFTVTVSRINESEHQAPEFTMEGNELEVKSDGSLYISTEAGGRSFSVGLYDGFTFQRLRVPEPAKKDE